MEEDSRHGHVLAPIPRRLLVEQCALGKDSKFKRVMYSLVELTVIGPDGSVGAYVPRAVVEGLKIEHEPARIPHRLTVAEIVVERTRRLALAITDHVQWTVIGRPGKPGADVRVHVVEEHRFDLVPAPIPHRLFVDCVVLGGVQKRSRAMRIFHVQFQVVGLTGVTGVAAQCPVVLEYSIDIGLVPIPRQRLVEHSVLGIIAKATPATEKIAQLMGAGVGGNDGADAQRHVLVGKNAERDIAINHAHQMVVKTALAMEWKS